MAFLKLYINLQTKMYL